MERLAKTKLDNILNVANKHSSNILLKYDKKHSIDVTPIFEDAINNSPTEEINNNLYDQAANIIALSLFGILDRLEDIEELSIDYENFLDAFYALESIIIYKNNTIKITAIQSDLLKRDKLTYLCTLSNDTLNNFLRTALLIFPFRGGDNTEINFDVVKTYRRTLIKMYETSLKKKNSRSLSPRSRK